MASTTSKTGLRDSRVRAFGKNDLYGLSSSCRDRHQLCPRFVVVCCLLVFRLSPLRYVVWNFRTMHDIVWVSSCARIVVVCFLEKQNKISRLSTSTVSHLYMTEAVSSDDQIPKGSRSVDSVPQPSASILAEALWADDQIPKGSKSVDSAPQPWVSILTEAGAPGIR